MIEVVSATRMSKKDFWDKSPLGLSLIRLASDARLTSFIAFENRRPLPEVFNARITTPKSPNILVFMHDDVWIDDHFLADRVIDGLNQYDVIGVAGNRNREKNQPAWPCKPLINGKLTWDDKINLSGGIAHGTQPSGRISFFGAAPAECELLDGVFLAAKKSTLTEQAVMFDPKFDFHFYDMDFCRSARVKGLRLGTWLISLTHESRGGGYNSQSWRDKFLIYQKKWES